MAAVEHFYEDRDAAVAATAKRLEAALVHDLARADRAGIVLSGGGTPAPVYRRLRDADLDWSRVTVTLSDERVVAPNHADSNAAMLGETLLDGAASAVAFEPLVAAGEDADAACRRLTVGWPALPRPFAATLLGMGADGHFASLFPDYAGLSPALDPRGSARYVPVTTKASPHARVSMTLAALDDSREILLLFFGEEKLNVYERAKQGAGRLPVGALLSRARAPVHVAWAP